MSHTNSYESPFCTRYASPEMQYLFSADKKFTTWRRLWVALARAEHQLGLPVTQAQVDQLEANVENIDYDVAREREKVCRHDVMSHVYAYGVACPEAKGIIHLGATSCYVGDNTDVIIMRDALQVVRRKLINVIGNLARFADSYKAMPALAYTHLQPAQLTTVGKRATLWINELLMDLEEIDHRIASLKLLGSKGTTGTQASFMELFEGDSSKVKQLEQMIAEEMGFDAVVPVSGQTYSRKVDAQVLAALGGVAQSASKFANDMRILQSFKEMEEPFEKGQIGSSAMAYKRNPMRSERISSLARFIIADTVNPAMTAGTQWLERTLDDSANRRISIPEAFLAADGILTLYINVISGVTVYPKVIEKHLREELPFMATENILMHCVMKGGDRQTLHEAIRRHSVAAGKAIKQDGADNDLLDRIAADPVFSLTRAEIDEIIAKSNFTGLAAEQTEDYLAEVRAVLAENADMLSDRPDATVNV